MLRVAICDDDELQVEILQNIFAEYNKSHLQSVEVNSFSSAEDMLARLPYMQAFDVFVLDVVMGAINGMELAKRLREQGAEGEIIFLTSSIDHVLNAFSVRAINYFLKPVDPEKLLAEIDNIRRACEKKNPFFLTLKTGKTEQTVSAKDIMYIEFVDRVSYYHLSNKKVFRGKQRRNRFADEMEPLLATGKFALCNISLAVNLEQVRTFQRGVITMPDGMEFTCTRTKIVSFREAWKRFQRMK